MVPESVKVPEGLLMFKTGRYEPVPPPVKVWAPVPSISSVAVPVAPTDDTVTFPLASRVPVLIVTGWAAYVPAKDRVPVAVKVVPLAMVRVSQ